MTDKDAVTYDVGDVWLKKADRRTFALVEGHPEPPWPAWRAAVVWYVEVREGMRRQGVCKRFLAEIAAAPGVEAVVVWWVQNRHLGAALRRWGWECHEPTNDFYLFTQKERAE